MKSGLFLSEEEQRRQSEIIKHRQERLLQVRQECREMSAFVLDRVKRNAARQYEETENRVLSEIREYHLKELAAMRAQYEKCINDINQQHYVKQVQNENRVQLSHKKKPCPPKSAVKSAEPKFNIPQKENKNRCVKTPTKRSVSFAKDKIKKPNNSSKADAVSATTLPPNIVIDSDENANEKRFEEIHGDECYDHFTGSENGFSLSKNCTEATLQKIARQKKFNISDSGCLNNLCEHQRHRCLCAHSNPNPEIDVSKTKLDQIYNEVVHDRIRLLEQQEKFLCRQALWLQDTNNETGTRPPRFSEYLTSFYKKNASDGAPLGHLHRTGSREIVDDIDRVHRKKKLLVQDLVSVDTQTDFTNSLVEDSTGGKPSKRVSNSVKVSDEKPSSSTDGNRKSAGETSSNEETLRKRLSYPSPIAKRSDVGSGTAAARLRMEKYRNSKKKSPPKTEDVLVTVLRNKALVANANSSSALESCTATQSSIESDETNGTSRKTVKVIVNVLAKSEHKKKCRKKAEKKSQQLQTDAKVNFDKLQNWRKLFENEEKLTESSYFSPPETTERFGPSVAPPPPPPLPLQYAKSEAKIIPPVDDIGYYVGKLLRMRRESIENLNVSSSSTTVNEFHAFKHVSSQTVQTEEQNTTAASNGNDVSFAAENALDSENVRELLFKYLKMAASSLPDIRGGGGGAQTSTQQQRDPLNEQDLNALTDAFRRLLPLYQNSFDDSVDGTIWSALYTAQQQQKLQDESRLEEEGSACVSTPAYLQKFVSSVSDSFDTRKENDIINYLLEQNADNQRRNVSVCGSAAEVIEDDSKLEVEEAYALPSIAELIRRGFITEPATDEKCQNSETFDEEEFIRKILEVNIPSSNAKPEDGGVAASATEQHSELESVRDAKRKPFVNPENIFDESNVASNELRKELRLMGLNWMDTTMQRTLQASAINSTSSADDSNGPVRHMPPVAKVAALHYESSKVTSDNAQSSNERLSFSPVTIPDVHLTLPRIFKDS